MVEGVAEVVAPANEGNWEKRQTMLGFQVPTDPDEKRLHYLRTVVMRGKDDIETLMSVVSEMSGIDAQAEATALKTFRDSVAGEGREPNAPDGTGPAGG
jgi:hypothetical protein